MPRVKSTQNRIQRAFAPLLFSAHFQPERLRAPPTLPWHTTFPPHIDGKPVEDGPLAEDRESRVAKVPLIKLKRPSGEPGRKGERGFNLKGTLQLPEAIYDDLLAEVHSLAVARLNLATTITNQSQEAILLVCKELKQKFPVLEERFEGDWPAKAMIQIFLKTTSSKTPATKSK